MANAVTSPASGAAYAPFTSTGDVTLQRAQVEQPLPEREAPPVEKPVEQVPARERSSEQDFQQFIKDQVERANRQAESLNLLYRYGIREATGDFFVQVMDSRRQEVLRTIPPEYLLELREKLVQGLGVLLDQEA